MTHHLLEIELANGTVIPLSIEAESLDAAKQLVQKRLEQLCMRTDYILGNPCPNCHNKQVEIEELKGRIRGYQETNSTLVEDYKHISVVAEQRDEELQRLRAEHGKSCKDNYELIKRIEQVKQQYESSTQRGMDLEQKLHNAQESLTAALETNVEANRLLIRARSEVHTLEKHIKQREDEIKELRQAFVKLEAAGPQYSCQLLPYGMLPNESVAQFVKRLHTDLKKAEEDSQLCRQRHREAVEERYELEQKRVRLGLVE
jgi:cell division septum initiation protein DivIVA